MGETGAACLLRSFSHPSDATRQYKEVDPIRCLTESISFGRYYSDSLAWEKWSTFSHNRHLEEVEKFSKPGSVAEKKAFFEAHYKKKAAAKAAASQPTVASAESIVVQESENTCIARDNSPINLKSAQANNQVLSYGEKAEARAVALQFTETSSASGAAAQESENTYVALGDSSVDLNSAKANNEVASYGEKTEARAATKVVPSQFKEVNAASGAAQESENTYIAQENSSIDLNSAKANNEVASYGEKTEARAAAKVVASQFTEVNAAGGAVQELDNIPIAWEKSSINLDSAKASNQVVPYGGNAEVRTSAMVATFAESSSLDLESTKASDQVVPNGGKAEVRTVAEVAAAQSEEASGIVCESKNTDLAQENSSIDIDPLEASNLVQSIEQHEKGMPSVCVENSEDANELELNNSEDMLGAAVTDVEETSKEVSDGDHSQGEDICHSHSENIQNHAEIMTSQNKETSVKEAVEEQISTSAETKKLEASSSKLSIQKRLSKFPFSHAKERTSLPSKNGKCVNPSSDKSAVNTADKKRLTTKSLHMSINLASAKGNNNKTVFPVLPLIKKASDRKLPSIIQKDISVLHKSSTLVTNVDSKHASGIQKACTKRSEALHLGGLVAEKSSEIKSSNALGRKAQNPTVCSPFRFRSEERAAKRKEKLEEKVNAKVEEKSPLQERFKSKEEQTIRKSHHGFGLKTRLNTESSQQVQSSNDFRMISHTRSQLPRFGKNIASASDRESKSKPPRQSSVNVNTESFKYINGKGNRMVTHSVTSLPSRNLHENASPNIQTNNERRKAV